VQLEGVWAIAVGGLLLQVLGQVDDHDGVEGAFLQGRKRLIVTCPITDCIAVRKESTGWLLCC
jgi:hypothetical protein